MPETLGDAIDQIVTIPMRIGTETLPRERLRHLYEEARKRQGDKSLCMQAAQGIAERVHEGDWVFLITGVGEMPWLPAGEMDGPPGAVSLARALAYGVGARPLYLAEALTIPSCTKPSQAAGVPIHDPDLLDRFSMWRSASAIGMPLGDTGTREIAEMLLDRFKPKAMVAVEKLGPNACNEFAAIDGYIPRQVADCVSPILFELAKERGIFTVGVGDGGNELGTGVVEDIANSYSGPTAFRKGGNGTRIKANVGILATVSNWGAYGISAALAFLWKNLDCIQDSEIEERILQACASERSVDFGAGVPWDQADGKSLAVNQAIVTLLRNVVASRLRERGKPFLPKFFTQEANVWAQMRAALTNEQSQDRLMDVARYGSPLPNGKAAR